jgi:hypothetical protein
MWRFRYFILAFATLCQSCWTGEDPIKVKDDLVGGFKIIEDESGLNSGFILTLNYGKGYFKQSKSGASWYTLTLQIFMLNQIGIQPLKRRSIILK